MDLVRKADVKVDAVAEAMEMTPAAGLLHGAKVMPMDVVAAARGMVTMFAMEMDAVENETEASQTEPVSVGLEKAAAVGAASLAEAPTPSPRPTAGAASGHRPPRPSESASLHRF